MNDHRESFGSGLGRLKTAAVALTLCALGAAAQAPSDVRVALVIGNSAYAGPLALKNPSNDAAAMSAALRKLGFTVIEARDATRAGMEDAVKKLFSALKGKQGVGMLYFAGHGIQLDWKNYMIPVDAKLQSQRDVAVQTLDVADVLDALKAAGSRMNIVVLDACRDNPFSEKGAKGLAPVDAPPGTFLAYATAPGNVAEDGSGENGLYTKHLLAELQKPVGIESVFKRVRLNVRKESQGRQIPWESTSLEEDFNFSPAEKAVAPDATAAAVRRDEAYSRQKLEWDRIKESSNPDDFYAFLAQFPTGLIAEVAAARLERLSASPVVVQGFKGENPQARIADRMQVGDEWTIRETTRGGFFGSSSSDYTFKVLRLNAGLLEVDPGVGRAFFTPEGAWAGIDSTFTGKHVYDPPQPLLPMGMFQVGHKSSSRSSLVIGGKPSGGFDVDMHVVGREMITTKLGTFNAYKVVIDTSEAQMFGSTPRRLKYVKWFVPEMAVSLKETVEGENGSLSKSVETIAYKKGQKS